MTHAAPLALIAFALLASCGDEEASLGPSPSQGNQSDEDLVGQTFASSSAMEGDALRPLVDGKPIRLTFEGWQERQLIGWGASCNRFGARLEITAERLQIGPISGTAMGCPADSEAQDEWLSGFFGANPEWELEDARLRLRSGESIIEFEETNR
jgi:heat shock protein HslJ